MLFKHICKLLIKKNTLYGNQSKRRIPVYQVCLSRPFSKFSAQAPDKFRLQTNSGSGSYSYSYSSSSLSSSSSSSSFRRRRRLRPRRPPPTRSPTTPRRHLPRRPPPRRRPTTRPRPPTHTQKNLNTI